MKIVLNFLFIFGCLLAMNSAKAQFFAQGGFDLAYSPLDKTNGIIESFNVRENHSISKVITMPGYHFGIGKYSEFTRISIGFGSIAKKQTSKNPALLKETVEYAVNLTSVDASFGIKPFKRQFHSFGASLHMGQVRHRYSFGGDYIIPISRYGIWAEFFADFAFKFRFLIKKEMREKNFYIFNIKPYYRLNQPVDLHNMERDFNESTTVQFGDIVESMNQFGIQIGLTIPFLNKEEQEKYKLGGTIENERLLLRQEKALRRLEKKESRDVPRGRL